MICLRIFFWKCLSVPDVHYHPSYFDSTDSSEEFYGCHQKPRSKIFLSPTLLVASIFPSTMHCNFLLLMVLTFSDSFAFLQSISLLVICFTHEIPSILRCNHISLHVHYVSAPKLLWNNLTLEIVLRILDSRKLLLEFSAFI